MGIYPFDKDVVLSKMVGSLSSQHTQQLPHVAALETTAFDLHLSDRHKKKLNRDELDLDALNLYPPGQNPTGSNTHILRVGSSEIDLCKKLYCRAYVVHG